MLLLIYVVIICIFAVVLVKLIDKFLPSKSRTLVSLVLWGVCVFIAYSIYASVMKPIEFKRRKKHVMKKR